MTYLLIYCAVLWTITISSTCYLLAKETAETGNASLNSSDWFLVIFAPISMPIFAVSSFIIGYRSAK